LLGIIAFAALFFVSLLVIYFGYHIAAEHIVEQPALFYITLSGFVSIWFVTIFSALILADKIITG